MSGELQNDPWGRKTTATNRGPRDGMRQNISRYNEEEEEEEHDDDDDDDEDIQGSQRPSDRRNADAGYPQVEYNKVSTKQSVSYTVEQKALFKGFSELCST